MTLNSRFWFNQKRDIDGASWMRRLPLLLFLVIAGLCVFAYPHTSRAQNVANDTEPAAAEVPLDSPLLREPETPDETFDAVMLLLDLARPKLARRYLDKFMSLDPDDDAILKLRDKHGPATFLKLANIRELQPVSDQLLKRMNSVFSQWASDPARIDELISMLAESPAKREVAIIQLREAGTAIVPRMLEHVRQPQNVDRSTLLYTLSRLGRAVVPPLVGALESPDPNLRASVAEVLGWIGAVEVVPFLWYPAFGSDQPPGVQVSAKEALNRILNPKNLPAKKLSSVGAVDEMYRLARTNFQGDYTGLVSEDGAARFWRWDTRANTVVELTLQPEDAAQRLGRRLAYESLALSPERTEFQALLLGFVLARARSANWSRPLQTGPGTAHNLGLVAGSDVVTQTLRDALDHHNVAAALGALQLLGQIGTRHQLQVRGRDKSPLLTSLNYPNQRVQFAAANTILQLDPIDSFPGQERVIAIMIRALSGDGEAQAAIVDPNRDRASVTGSLLQEMGYAPLLARTGQDGFKLAAMRSDVELAIIHANSIRWELSQTIENFRADARTAAIPIAIYGPNHLRSELQRKANRYPLTTVVVESSTPEAVNIQLRPYLAAMSTPILTEEQRAEQKRIAAFWLAHIASGRRTSLFNIDAAEDALFEASADPELAGDCLLALGSIATRGTQSRLYELTVNNTIEAGIREIAAGQLAFHIQRFGLLLSDSNVNDVFSAWNQTTDSNLKSALATVIGSLKPNAKRVSDRLLNHSSDDSPTSTPTPAAVESPPAAQP